MKVKFISAKYGVQFIDTEKYDPSAEKSYSTLFRCVEYLFEKWWKTAPSEYISMYLGEEGCPPIYTRKGAIRQGIELFIESVIEEFEGKSFVILDTRDLVRLLDIEAAFQD
jgi:hypothetical protein